MKKIVYSLAVLFSVALVSCGGNAAKDADSASDSASVEVTEVTETVVADSANADSAAAPAAATTDSAKTDSAK